ncbi:hypothetical protein pb186bvf_013931 [Paramecium bursaria]
MYNCGSIKKILEKIRHVKKLSENLEIKFRYFEYSDQNFKT